MKSPSGQFLQQFNGSLDIDIETIIIIVIIIIMIHINIKQYPSHR